MLIKNGFVCLHILICRNQKICHRHARPVHPFWQFLYVQLCSSMQNLFLNCRNLNLSFFQNYRWNHFLNFLICQSWTLFLNLPICRSLNLNLNQIFQNRNVHHRARLPLPFWQFGSVLIGSLMQSLVVKFHFRFLTGLCLMIPNQIRLESLHLLTRNRNYLGSHLCLCQK